MKSIFVPLDLSDQSYEALDYAIHLAGKTLAKKLVVFHSLLPVYNPQPELAIVYIEDQERVQEEIKELLEKKLATAIQNSDLDSDSLITEIVVVQEAGPVSAIVAQAAKIHAQLIVMSTHGSSGFLDLFSGSVSEGVIEETDIPILAIPLGYQFKDINKIAFTTSLEHFKSEINAVLPFAKALEAGVEAVHINYGISSDEKIEEAKTTVLETGYEGLTLQTPHASAEDMLVYQLTEYIQWSSPDWMVMFPHEMSWYEKLFFSSKTEDMLSKTEIPLLVLHK